VYEPHSQGGCLRGQKWVACVVKVAGSAVVEGSALVTVFGCCRCYTWPVGSPPSRWVCCVESYFRYPVWLQIGVLCGCRLGSCVVKVAGSVTTVGRLCPAVEVDILRGQGSSWR
jgi:hypothetical protein